jgi:hypothetical protein
MSIYERILHIDERTFDALMSAGVLRANAKRDLEMYGHFLRQRERRGAMQAITDTACKFILSEESVKHIIYKQINIYKQLKQNDSCKSTN